MTSGKITVQLVIFIVILNILGCSNLENSTYGNASIEYTELLSKFPVDNQGKGFDPLDTSTETQQASTYAQILSSESLHYANSPNAESSKRIREAVKWLLDNADLDNDGKPGWGFPFAWDAFGDGSVNPVDQPYTIDTAIVVIGMLDSLTLKEFWPTSDREKILYCVRDVLTRWCSEVYTKTDTDRGYFRYSTNPPDDYDVANVSSMFAGCLQRFLAYYSNILSPYEIDLYGNRADAVAKYINDKAVYHSDGPFWNYIDSPMFPARANDLVHHVYILFGMEMYRTFGGRESLSWTKNQGVNSLELFFLGPKLFNYPQNSSFANPLVNLNEPANLWGIGMMMAYYAQAGRIDKSEQCLNIIKTEYGSFPDITIFPGNEGYYHTNDSTFYPRFAAHVLYGLAVKEFRSYSF